MLVIGDTMVDRWVHGHAAPCQDGCDKFVQESVVEVPGGAANAERSISEWDVNTSLYGYALYDCPVKTRYVEEDKIVFRADDEGPTTRELDYDWCRRDALEIVPHASAVLLSDYDKGFLEPLFIAAVASACLERGIPCVADCKRAPALYPACILKCNSVYAIKHFDTIRCDDRRVITGGPSEPWFPDDPMSKMPPVKCVNHVGAGDCFAAHLTLALAYGFSLKEAAALAHSAGRIYVQHEHNRAPMPDEVIADMQLSE